MAPISSFPGATQTNVTGVKNWATIKGTGNVIVTVTLNPSVSENELPANFIEWTGGEAVEGSQLTRKVSKATSAKTTVKAKCGTSEKEVDIWVIWADITIQTSGNRPDRAPSFSLSDPICGPAIRPDQTEAQGNMVATATLSPSGVGDVVKKGWDIKRHKTTCIIVDGKVKDRKGEWIDDDSHNQDETLEPENNKIYSVDTPNVACFYSDITAFITVYHNFEEWVHWNALLVPFSSALLVPFFIILYWCHSAELTCFIGAIQQCFIGAIQQNSLVII